MEAKLKKKIAEYVNSHIDSYHTVRAEQLHSISLKTFVRRKNPYLFRVKNITVAGEFVEGMLQAHLSSSEETKFGDFLEALAVYVSEITCGGVKSSTKGIDIELSRNGIRYLIAVKSGPNWGNKSQHERLEQNFVTAVRVLKQNKAIGQIQPVEGICYGNQEDRDNGAFLRLCGQSFWELISGDPCFYIDIVEPLGFRAEEHAKKFDETRAEALNKLTGEFIGMFCLPSGKIDWEKLVKFVSRTNADIECP